ncbi:MAG: urease accessory protein UreD [Rhizobiales bacterium]|nr:urease accessory protein UreD [Hyphomicrobiales bacterium]
MQGAVTATADTFAQNRARGAVAFDVHVQDGMTRRRELHESGSLRVRFPSPEQQGLSAVFINTAGGVAGGDIFNIDIATGEGARLTATTAAAEKIYRSHGPDSQINVTLKADANSHISWLPQETILFDQVCAVRRFDIDLHETATLLLSEIVVFGRTAMNETVARGSFTDRWRLRRGGKLIFADTVKLDGDFAGKLASRAVANGGVAIGTALVVPGDESLVEKIRDVSSNFSSEFGISAWNGFALVRLCGSDAARLRADMIAVLACISPAGLPRLWLN